MYWPSCSWYSPSQEAWGLGALPQWGPLSILGPQTKQPTVLPPPKQELEEGHPVGLPTPSPRGLSLLSVSGMREWVDGARPGPLLHGEECS